MLAATQEIGPLTISDERRVRLGDRGAHSPFREFYVWTIVARILFPPVYALIQQVWTSSRLAYAPCCSAVHFRRGKKIRGICTESTGHASDQQDANRTFQVLKNTK
jgi:hypothetical protein